MTLVLIRGGGDLATGVALRLYRVGFHIVILELEQPLAVRRTVSFAEAVYSHSCTVEGVTARVVSPDQYVSTYEAGDIPVLIDPNASILANSLLTSPQSTIVIDARLMKQAPYPLPNQPALLIGLGPGYHAGENCQAVIETRRGHTLGRVYWSGSAQEDSGQPEGDPRRILRAPLDGVLIGYAEIGEQVEEGQLIAKIGDQPVVSPLKGVLRGLIHAGINVSKNMKIGDVDPRDDPGLCQMVSDKALSIGGGVLEALLSKPELRSALYSQAGN